LKAQFDEENYPKIVEDNRKNIEQIEIGTKHLYIGMFAWFSVITVVLVVVLICVCKKFESHDSDTDAESNYSGAASEKASVIDFNVFTIKPKCNGPPAPPAYESSENTSSSEQSEDSSDRDSNYGTGSSGSSSSVSVSVEDSKSKKPATIQVAEI